MEITATARFPLSGEQTSNLWKKWRNGLQKKESWSANSSPEKKSRPLVRLHATSHTPHLLPSLRRTSTMHCRQPTRMPQAGAACLYCKIATALRTARPTRFLGSAPRAFPVVPPARARAYTLHTRVGAAPRVCGSKHGVTADPLLRQGLGGVPFIFFLFLFFLICFFALARAVSRLGRVCDPGPA